jgi:hypothetical protein
MLATVCLSMQAFSDPPSLATLVWMARTYELVLVCPHHAAAPGRVSTLRTKLSGHVVIAVLLDGVPHQQERDVIDGILHDGHVPLMVTTRNPAAGATDWLDADIALSLPDGLPIVSHARAWR